MAKKTKLLSNKKQLEDLQKRFGSNGNWVQVNLPMTFNEVESYFGKECEEYNHLCGCCQAWSEWHKTHRVTVNLERKEIIQVLEKN